MALYLGNQKISLRSGQDPTFDYGFDSNGRLVFANKNATEINNFLNYDSTYSEILDLSNLSKMEKVAVNGTADRKMEGLKGLLVSPNAPFTGSSPQINVSYTGLNKSALVSLFESVPYNVGYKKVGNPTIVDGVASGFSGGDYLDIGNFLGDNIHSIENGVKFTTASTFLSLSIMGRAPGASPLDTGIFFRGATPGITVKYRISYDNGNSWQAIELPSSFKSIVYNHTYYANWSISTITNKMIVRFSEDGQNWITDELSFEPGAILENLTNQKIGRTGNHGAFLGSIDLNETYIKVNGVPWFGPGVTKNLVPAGTVVGDVTVKDGIASGFSDSDYINVSGSYTSGNDFEENICFTTGSTVSGNQELICLKSSGYFAHRILLQGNNTILVYYNDGTGRYLTVSYNMQALTRYSVKCTCYDKVLTATLYDNTGNQLATNTTTLANNLISASNIFMGSVGTASSYFNGSIDLNNTYIKVGSDYFYRGMVPMTKTCSIVGATGTADLTQEDKNIILNKGWSLTVQ